jgi:four helix bundle protein
MYQYPFEKLEVWYLAKKLAIDIYKLTATFPAEEKYGMVSQMRRAAVSVSSNIAEGTARSTAKDRANFYQMAYSSLMELLNQTIIASELSWIKAETYTILRTDVEHVSNKLNALRKSELKKK